MFQPEALAAAIAGLIGVLGTLALLFWRASVRQTTLVPAWWWSLIALWAWAGVEILAALSNLTAAWLAPLRYSAVALSFCPMMAVLGAKRPQHAAWSFIVLSLWAILALPAAETFFLQRGQRLEINDARSWFLWLLISLGPVNYLPTRHRLTALLLAAGQIIALSDYLPLIGRPLFSANVSVGLFIASIGLAAFKRPRFGIEFQRGRRFDRLWLDFRDSFGLLWALRLQERVNSVAQTNDWDVELSWSGFRDKQGQPIEQFEPAIEPALRTTLKGLLRRFVTNEWIADRLGSDLDLS